MNTPDPWVYCEHFAPICAYNPDWAILMVTQDAFVEEKERLYLVRDTKGTLDVEGRRGTENMKIDCVRRHFHELGVDYEDVAKIDQLLQIHGHGGG
jgi:type III restriction enzyme